MEDLKKATVIRNGNVNINTVTFPKGFSLCEPNLKKAVEAVYVKREQQDKPLVNLESKGLLPLERSWEINDLLSRYVDANYADYHKDWNRLMEEVVKKIELTHDLHITGNECYIEVTGYQSWSVVTVKAETKHQAVWIACYEFVRLFNSGADLLSRK